MLKRANDNDTITRLPILLQTEQDCGDGWFVSPAPTTIRGERVTKPRRNPVRVVPASALPQFASPTTRASFEAAYGSVREDFTLQLLSLLGIAGATKNNDLEKVAMLAERASGSRGKLATSIDTVSAVISPWDKVGATLNTGLFGIISVTPVMPVLWQKGSHLTPALLCQTPAQALFAHALFEVAGRQGMGVCRRCGNPFFATRTQHSYCGYRCRQAEAQKRYRRKLKSKESRRSKAAGRRKR